MFNNYEVGCVFLLVKVPLDDIQREWTESSSSYQQHVYMIASHYRVYQDLFNNAYFFPDSLINAGFEFEEDDITPVHLGNIIPAIEVGN